MSLQGTPFPPGFQFRTTRIKKGTVEKPWLTEKRDPREWWANIMPVIGLVVGLIGAGLIVWLGFDDVPKQNECLIMNYTFSDGWDPKIWTKEVELGGYGNGQFEMTTDTDENVFIKDGTLVIRPTLQDPHLMTHNNVLNLTKEGICTSNIWYNCVASTNTTNGTVINPVKSGRIHTKTSASIKYGRIEVTAKMPAGDWLWPAIWMLPVKNTYGAWPASGEIDILESRGNNYTYPKGNNWMSSTLHWGPDPDEDQWWRDQKFQQALHTTWAHDFQTYGLMWSEDYLFSYIKTQLDQVTYVKFDGPMWKKGQFPPSTDNGTRLVDPWSQTGRPSTPFDQEFYLILDVAVGGTNGWFEDGVGAKPWVDASPTAKRDFWNARDEWYPTWKKGGQLEVQSVKMWQQKGYKGCK